MLELPLLQQPCQGLLSCLSFLCQPRPSSVLLILLDQLEAVMAATVEIMEAAKEEMAVASEMVALAVALLETEPTLFQPHLRLVVHTTRQSAHLLPIQVFQLTPALQLPTQLALVSLSSD